MSTRIKLVQGDTRPSIIVDMLDRSTWAPIDVSAAGTVVTMKFKAVGSDTILQTITATKLTGQLLPDGTTDPSVSPAGAGGRVSFAWPTGALDVDQGNYEGEISIAFADGTLQTIYDTLSFYVRADF